MIPTYRANGRRVSDSKPDRAARLLQEGLVAGSYTRHGRLRSIQFKHDCGRNPVSKRAHQGQRYSYPAHLPSGYHAWTHRDLIGKHDIEGLFGELTPAELQNRELFIRSVFRAVPLSVLRGCTPAHPAPAAPTTHRPVEFDSQMRLGA